MIDEQVLLGDCLLSGYDLTFIEQVYRVIEEPTVRTAKICAL